MCPVLLELKKQKMQTFVCISGQHSQMVEEVLALFGVRPDADLKILRRGQSLGQITGRILAGLEPIVERERPALLLVHGDTATAFSAALAAFYQGVPLGHIEAGLRTYDMRRPFPEEWNRRAISLLADYHFAPTQAAAENLSREGIPSDRIFITGNTGIDALGTTVRKEFSHPLLSWGEGGRLLLITAHRRETKGAPLRGILRGIRRAVLEVKDTKALFFLHKDPLLRQVAREELGQEGRIRLSEPLSPMEFHNLLARCTLVLTDSGGIQEEALALGRPALVLRDKTERPEGVLAGGLSLAGTQEEGVYQALLRLLSDPAYYAAMQNAPNPFGDGRASLRIVESIQKICRRKS